MLTKALVVLMPFVMAACEVGEVPINGGTGIDAPISTTTDSGISPTTDAPVAALCAPRASPVTVAHLHSAGATTHAGENCVVAGCHLATNVGTGAPGMQFGGTLYGTDGITPNKGATVYFKNAAGTTVLTTTDTAGNFYMNAGSLPQGFPALVSASVCPTTGTGSAPTPMTEAVQNTGGGCALAGCHTPGAGQGAIKLDPTI
jgi:hypothetical protein